MPWTSSHVCSACSKAFVTDNAWIVCGPEPNLAVKAYFCSQGCRTAWCLQQDWVYNGLRQLVPPDHPSLAEIGRAQ